MEEKLHVTLMTLVPKTPCCWNNLAAQNRVYFSNLQTLHAMEPPRAQPREVEKKKQKLANWLYTLSKYRIPKKRFPQRTPTCEIPPANPQTISLTLRGFHIKRGPLPTNALNINCEIATSGL